MSDFLSAYWWLIMVALGAVAAIVYRRWRGE
jgi:hypothetical protein